MFILTDFITEIRELRKDCPATIILLPPRTKGLSNGSYNLSLLLEAIAMNLEDRISKVKKGSRHEMSNDATRNNSITR